MESHGSHVVEREAENRKAVNGKERQGRAAYKGFPEYLASESDLGSDGLVELIIHSAPTILYVAAPHQKDNVLRTHTVGPLHKPAKCWRWEGHTVLKLLVWVLGGTNLLLSPVNQGKGRAEGVFKPPGGPAMLRGRGRLPLAA